MECCRGSLSDSRLIVPGGHLLGTLLSAHQRSASTIEPLFSPCASNTGAVVPVTGLVHSRFLVIELLGRKGGIRKQILQVAWKPNLYGVDNNVSCPGQDKLRSIEYQRDRTATTQRIIGAVLGTNSSPYLETSKFTSPDLHQPPFSGFCFSTTHAPRARTEDAWVMDQHSIQPTSLLSLWIPPLLPTQKCRNPAPNQFTPPPGRSRSALTPTGPTPAGTTITGAPGRNPPSSFSSH